MVDAKKPGDAFMMQVKYKDNTRMIALEIPNNIKYIILLKARFAYFRAGFVFSKN